MPGVVVRNIPRPDPGVVAGIAECGVAAVHESQHRRGMLAARLRPLFAGARIAGAAVTVSAPAGDNWTMHVAVEQLQSGDFPVVAPTSPCDDAYCGELIATSIRARGGIGLVADAGIRDARELAEMQFPVWSKTVWAQGAVKETVGAVNLPLVCAGQLINPGDILVADDDGVCVVRREESSQVLAAARERTAKEEDKRRRLAAGELALDIDNMRPRLAEKAVKYL